MGMKKKLGLGMASAALGLSLIGGGTFAYFNDTATVDNNFKTGTLDLSVDPTIAFNLENLKPGDYMTRDFTMSNAGTLDIYKVLMTTTVNDATMAGHFKVDFLDSDGKEITDFKNRTLAQLAGMASEDITPAFVNGGGRHSSGTVEAAGIPVGTTDKITIKITFVDNGQNQNSLQGKTLNVKFNLEALQELGEQR